jgi:hypothetical protein
MASADGQPPFDSLLCVNNLCINELLSEALLGTPVDPADPPAPVEVAIGSLGPSFNVATVTFSFGRLVDVLLRGAIAGQEYSISGRLALSPPAVSFSQQEPTATEGGPVPTVRIRVPVHFYDLSLRMLEGINIGQPNERVFPFGGTTRLQHLETVVTYALDLVEFQGHLDSQDLDKGNFNFHCVGAGSPGQDLLSWRERTTVQWHTPGYPYSTLLEDEAGGAEILSVALGSAAADTWPAVAEKVQFVHTVLFGGQVEIEDGEVDYVDPLVDGFLPVPEEVDGPQAPLAVEQLRQVLHLLFCAAGHPFMTSLSQQVRDRMGGVPQVTSGTDLADPLSQLPEGFVPFTPPEVLVPLSGAVAGIWTPAFYERFRLLFRDVRCVGYVEKYVSATGTESGGDAGAAGSDQRLFPFLPAWTDKLSATCRATAWGLFAGPDPGVQGGNARGSWLFICYSSVYTRLLYEAATNKAAIREAMRSFPDSAQWVPEGDDKFDWLENLPRSDWKGGDLDVGLADMLGLHADAHAIRVVNRATLLGLGTLAIQETANRTIMQASKFTIDPTVDEETEVEMPEFPSGETPVGAGVGGGASPDGSQLKEFPGALENLLQSIIAAVADSTSFWNQVEDFPNWLAGHDTDEMTSVGEIFLLQLWSVTLQNELQSVWQPKSGVWSSCPSDDAHGFVNQLFASPQQDLPAAVAAALDLAVEVDNAALGLAQILFAHWYECAATAKLETNSDVKKSLEMHSYSFGLLGNQWLSIVGQSAMLVGGRAVWDCAVAVGELRDALSLLFSEAGLPDDDTMSDAYSMALANLHGMYEQYPDHPENVTATGVAGALETALECLNAAVANACCSRVEAAVAVAAGPLGAIGQDGLLSDLLSMANAAVVKLLTLDKFAPITAQVEWCVEYALWCQNKEDEIIGAVAPVLSLAAVQYPFGPQLELQPVISLSLVRLQAAVKWLASMSAPVVVTAYPLEEANDRLVLPRHLRPNCQETLPEGETAHMLVAPYVSAGTSQAPHCPLPGEDIGACVPIPPTWDGMRLVADIPLPKDILTLSPDEWVEWAAELVVLGPAKVASKARVKGGEAVVSVVETLVTGPIRVFEKAFSGLSADVDFKAELDFVDIRITFDGGDFASAKALLSVFGARLVPSDTTMVTTVRIVINVELNKAMEAVAAAFAAVSVSLLLALFPWLAGAGAYLPWLCTYAAENFVLILGIVEVCPGLDRLLSAFGVPLKLGLETALRPYSDSGVLRYHSNLAEPPKWDRILELGLGGSLTRDDILTFDLLMRGQHTPAGGFRSVSISHLLQATCRCPGVFVLFGAGFIPGFTSVTLTGPGVPNEELNSVLVLSPNVMAVLVPANYSNDIEGATECSVTVTVRQPQTPRADATLESGTGGLVLLPGDGTVQELAHLLDLGNFHGSDLLRAKESALQLICAGDPNDPESLLCSPSLMAIPLWLLDEAGRSDGQEFETRYPCSAHVQDFCLSLAGPAAGSGAAIAVPHEADWDVRVVLPPDGAEAGPLAPGLYAGPGRNFRDCSGRRPAVTLSPSRMPVFRSAEFDQWHPKECLFGSHAWFSQERGNGQAFPKEIVPNPFAAVLERPDGALVKLTLYKDNALRLEFGDAAEKFAAFVGGNPTDEETASGQEAALNPDPAWGIQSAQAGGEEIVVRAIAATRLPAVYSNDVGIDYDVHASKGRIEFSAFAGPQPDGEVLLSDDTPLAYTWGIEDVGGAIALVTEPGTTILTKQGPVHVVEVMQGWNQQPPEGRLVIHSDKPPKGLRVWCIRTVVKVAPVGSPVPYIESGDRARASVDVHIPAQMVLGWCSDKGQAFSNLNYPDLDSKGYQPPLTPAEMVAHGAQDPRKKRLGHKKKGHRPKDSKGDRP